MAFVIVFCFIVETLKLFITNLDLDKILCLSLDCYEMMKIDMRPKSTRIIKYSHEQKQSASHKLVLVIL
jgi:hypothetical protein